MMDVKVSHLTLGPLCLTVRSLRLQRAVSVHHLAITMETMRGSRQSHIITGFQKGEEGGTGGKMDRDGTLLAVHMDKGDSARATEDC